MTRAVLLALLTLCCARVSVVDADPQNVDVSCKQDEKIAVDVTEPVTLTLSCPPGEPFFPEHQDSKPDVYYTGTEDTTKGTLGSSVPGATRTKVPGQEHQNKLDIPQIPKEAVTLVYRCKKEQGPSCQMSVRIAAAKPLGPNGCVVEKISLDIQAAPMEARFKCGVGMQLNEQGDKAFDSQCSKALALPPEVVLTREPGDMHVVTLKQLLKDPMELCFVCAAGQAAGGASPKRCDVHVRLAGGNTSASTRLGAGARAGSALGLAIVAASYLYSS